VTHRWLSIALLAWLVVIALTGAWLVERHAIADWTHGDRYRTSAGDVGPAAAVDAALAASSDDTAVATYVVMPRNGRGVYQVTVTEEAGAGATRTAYVDPGSGTVNGTASSEEGFTWWMYRGHMYLWQDQGPAAVFAPGGWCAPDAPDGPEPGGLRGAVCDAIPGGDDIAGWFAVAWIVVLVTGFYVWYWPGVRRWAQALMVRRNRGPFTFNMSLHKAVGFVVWVPLVIVSFTGAAFAFPNMAGWYENVTPAGRDEHLWEPPEEFVSSDGAPLDLDEVRSTIEQRFPDRSLESITPATEPGALVTAWVTRGFSPWSREGGAGNVLVALDAVSGEVVFDGTPEQVDVFGQAWQDWSFPLHTGDVGGPITRPIWVVLALTPLVLGVTGVMMQLIRRRKRRRRGVGDTSDDVERQHRLGETAAEVDVLPDPLEAVGGVKGQ
jgi:uncharacterized iron-regulated membrane protein